MSPACKLWQGGIQRRKASLSGRYPKGKRHYLSGKYPDLGVNFFAQIAHGKQLNRLSLAQKKYLKLRNRALT